MGRRNILEDFQIWDEGFTDEEPTWPYREDNEPATLTNWSPYPHGIVEEECPYANED